MAGMFKFLREVRSEGEKITWPTKRETVTNTIMVFVLVSFFSVFLFFADRILATFVRLILGIGG